MYNLGAKVQKKLHIRKHKIVFFTKKHTNGNKKDANKTFTSIEQEADTNLTTNLFAYLKKKQYLCGEK